MSEAGRTFVLGIAAAAFLLLVHVSTDVDPERRNLEFLPDMARSLAAESYGVAPVLPGGCVQQAPQPGVVVRGFPPFPYPATPEGAEAAGRGLVSPVAATDEAARARGADRFAIFCSPCHGGDGEGTGRAVERGMVRPPSLLAARARALPDGQLFHILTVGQGNMAPQAAVLSPSDRWKVILHVRALQGAKP